METAQSDSIVCLIREFCQQKTELCIEMFIEGELEKHGLSVIPLHHLYIVTNETALAL